MGSVDHFKTLGVPLDAGTQEIKQAFRKLALNLHPDRYTTECEQTRAACASRFKAITEAYEILSDDQQRAMYKARLGRDGGPWTSHTGSSHSSPDFTGSHPQPTDSPGGAWQRAQRNGFKSIIRSRLELLLVLGVTVVGIAGVGLSDYLWSREQAMDQASSHFTHPTSRTKSPMVKTYTGPGCGQRGTLFTTPGQAELFANLPLSEILAREEGLVHEADQELVEKLTVGDT